MGESFFNNREMAVILWLLIFLICCMVNKKLRMPTVGLVKAALRWKLILVVTVIFVYVSVVVLSMKRIGLWQFEDCFKTTFLWGIMVAIPVAFSLTSIKDECPCFSKVIWDMITLSVFVEVFIHFFVFPLIVEFIVVPLMTFLFILHAVAATKEEFKRVKGFLEGLLGVAGLLLFTGTCYVALHSEVKWMEILQEFLLPLNLTVIFIPLAYLIAIVAYYEELFIVLSFMVKDDKVARFAKIESVKRFHLDFQKLRLWRMQFPIDRPQTTEDVIQSMERAVGRDF